MASCADARKIGQDAFGYFGHDTRSFQWMDVSGTGTQAMFLDIGSFIPEDDGAATVPIGFEFSFYGTPYTQVSFNQNGLMTFGNASDAFFNVDLSSQTAPRADEDFPCVAVLWDDWSVEHVLSNVYYETAGEIGNQRLIVQWDDVRYWYANQDEGNPGDGVSFQVVLFEGGENPIMLNFLDVDSNNSAHDNGASATIGIRDKNGHNNGENLLWLYNAEDIYDGTTIMFEVPEPGTFALFGLGLLGVILYQRRRKRPRQ